MAHKTQIERIEEYINEYGSITPMDAFMDLGITKLATRISTMIRSGYAIKKNHATWAKSLGATNQLYVIRMVGGH